MSKAPVAQAEEDLATLEGPIIEEMNARSALATLETLIATTPHEGAKAAMQKDLADARQRHEKAHKARAGSDASQQDIDRAAQRVIDAREE